MTATLHNQISVGGSRLGADPSEGFNWLNPQPWADRALCAQVEPDLWFPEVGGPVAQAKAICRECPVKAECLQYSLDNDERHGVWGGLSDHERRMLRRGQDITPKLKACQQCGTTFHADMGPKKFCSHACKNRAKRERDRKAAAQRTAA